MSAERQLSLALFGKHPGFGDFLAGGELPNAALQPLLEWFANTLGAWRDMAGPDWQAVFDAAPALHFWIGAVPGGGAGLRGVAVPSRDRTGRRFPLVIAQSPAGLAPVTDPDQAFYEQAVQALAGLLAEEHFDARETATRLAATLPAAVSPDPALGSDFWGTNPTRAAADLLAELAATDQAHAQAGRSYWWFAADGAGRPAGLLAVAGLPGAAEMGWLLVSGQPPATATDTAPEDAT
ncbi:MAG: type VI secretion system-associated protein TagF [Paracoccus sp. (in: a-proteobacteria)]|nr:type VI secretion system-associated protein TagF [Paracoccus sp. (in: a-proteobacteria)]